MGIVNSMKSSPLPSTENGSNPGGRVVVVVGGRVHLHVSPIDTNNDLDFANADPNASAESLDEAAERIRAALSDLGYEAAS